MLELFERNGFWMPRINISVHLFLLFSEKVWCIFIWLLLNTAQFLILYKMIYSGVHFYAEMCFKKSVYLLYTIYTYYYQK